MKKKYQGFSKLLKENKTENQSSNNQNRAPKRKRIGNIQNEVSSAYHSIFNVEALTENPDDDRIQSASDIIIYDKIKHDPIVATAEELIRKQALTIDWHIDSQLNEDDENHKQLSELDSQIINFINESFNSFKYGSFLNTLNNLMDARIYGYKIAELIWEFDNKMILLTGMKCKRSEYFEFETDEFFNIKKLKQIEPTTKVLPISKFVIATWPYRYNYSPIGVSAYKEIYRDVLIKNKLEEIRNKGIEFALIPSVLAYYHNGLPAEDKDTFRREISKMRNSTITTLGVGIDEDGKLMTPEIEILSDRIKKEGFDIVASTIEYIENRIKRKMGLPDKIGFSGAGTGSYAQAKVEYDLFSPTIENIHVWISDILNEQVIPKMIAYNFATPNDYKIPKIGFDELDETLTEVKIKIADGLIKNKLIKSDSKWLSQYLGIPHQELIEAKEEAEKNREEFQKSIADNQNENQNDNENDDNNKDKDENEDDNDIKKKALSSDLSSNTNNLIDYASIETFINKSETKSLSELENLLKELSKSYDEQVKQVIDNKKSISELKAPKSWIDKFATLLSAFLAENYVYGSELADKLLKNQAKKLSDIDNLKDIIKLDANFKNADKIITDYLKKSGQKLKPNEKKWIEKLKTDSLILPESLTADIQKKIQNLWLNNDIEAIGQAKMAKIVNEAVNGEVKNLKTLIRTNRALHQNRAMLFKYKNYGSDLVALKYDATLDNRTTFYCRQHDGEIIRIDNKDLLLIVPPNHYNCRSFLVPVYKADFKGETYNKKHFETKEAKVAYDTPDADFGGEGSVSIGKTVEASENKLHESLKIEDSMELMESIKVNLKNLDKKDKQIIHTKDFNFKTNLTMNINKKAGYNSEIIIKQLKTLEDANQNFIRGIKEINIGISNFKTDVTGVFNSTQKGNFIFLKNIASKKGETLLQTQLKLLIHELTHNLYMNIIKGNQKMKWNLRKKLNEWNIDEEEDFAEFVSEKLIGNYDPSKLLFLNISESELSELLY